MAACQKNNQPVWPVKLQEKINLLVRRQVSPQGLEKILQEAGKKYLPVHMAASRKQNKTTNLSLQAGETNYQPVRPVQMQETKEQSTFVAIARKTNKTMVASPHKQGKTTMINMCRMLPPQATTATC